MTEIELEKLKYPIGHFEYTSDYSKNQLSGWLRDLKALPEKLSIIVKAIANEQLETPYRPSGWNVRQLVHHIADSHHHSYTRFKWALTEDKPIIKAYEEKNWAKLHDGKNAPIQLSLDYIKTLHAKMVFMLEGLSEADLQRRYIHPENNSEVTIVENIAKYAWHGNHHYAHIENLCKLKGWI